MSINIFYLYKIDDYKVGTEKHVLSLIFVLSLYN